MILSSIGLSGCNFAEKATAKTPKALILENWDTEIEDINIHIIFYENNSVCATVARISVWSQYNMSKDQRIFTNSDGTILYNDYSFRDNNQKLTISNPRRRSDDFKKTIRRYLVWKKNM